MKNGKVTTYVSVAKFAGFFAMSLFIATFNLVLVGCGAADEETATVQLQGPAGTNGTNGVDGKDGLNGTNGVDGKDGLNGTNGVDGKDGLNGTNGVDGKDAVMPNCLTGKPCNEDEYCNSQGICQEKVVVPSELQCSAVKPCPIGQACNPSGECVVIVPEPDCSNSKPCVSGKVCSAGQCVECVNNTHCDDGDALTGEACVAGVCQSWNLICAPNTACNDQNPNTTNDTCSADGLTCTGTTVVPVPNPDDTNVVITVKCPGVCQPHLYVRTIKGSITEDAYGDKFPSDTLPQSDTYTVTLQYWQIHNFIDIFDLDGNKISKAFAFELSVMDYTEVWGDNSYKWYGAGSHSLNQVEVFLNGTKVEGTFLHRRSVTVNGVKYFPGIASLVVPVN